MHEAGEAHICRRGEIMNPIIISWESGIEMMNKLIYIDGIWWLDLPIVINIGYRLQKQH